MRFYSASVDSCQKCAKSVPISCHTFFAEIFKKISFERSIEGAKKCFLGILENSLSLSIFNKFSSIFKLNACCCSYMIAGMQFSGVLPRCEKSLYFKGFRLFSRKGCSLIIAASAARSSIRSVTASPFD